MRLKQLIKSSLACIVAVGLLAVPSIAMAGDIHTSDMLDTDTASITKLKEDGLVSGTAPFDKDDQPGDDSTPNNTIIRSFDTATYGISYTVTPDDTMSYYRKARIGFTFTFPVDASIAGFDLDRMLWVDRTPGFEPKTSSVNGVQTLTCYRLLTPTDSSPTTVPGSSAITLVIKVKAAKNGTVIQPSVNSWVAWDATNPTSTGSHAAASLTLKALTVSAKTSLDVRVAGGQSATSEPMTWDFSKAQDAPNASLGKQTGTITAFSYAVDLRWPDRSKGLRGLQLPEGDLSFDVTMRAVYADVNATSSPHVMEEQWQPYVWDTTGTNPAAAPPDHVGRDTRSQYKFRGDNYQYARRSSEGSWSWTNNATYDNGNTTIMQGSRTKDGSVMHITVHDWHVDSDKFPLRAAGTKPTQCYFGDTSCKTIQVGEITVGTILAFSPTTVNGQTVQAIYGNKPQMQTVTGKVSNLTVASKSETDNITTDNTVNIVQPLLTSSHYWQRILYGCPTDSSAYSFGSNCGAWYGKEEYTGSDALPVGHKVALTNGFNYTSSISGLPVLQLGMVTWNPNHIDMSNVAMQHSINRSQNSWHYGANPTVRYGVKPDGTNWTNDTEQAKATVDALHWYDSYMEAAKHGKVVAALMSSNEIGALQTAGNNRNASTIIGGLVGVIRKDVTPNIVTQLTGYTVVYSRQTLHDKADAPDPQASDDDWRAWANDKDAYTLLSSVTPTWEIGSGNYVKASYDANGTLHDPTSGDLYGDSLLITGETNTVSKTVSQTDETGKPKTVYDLDKEQRIVDWKLTTKTTGNGSNTTVTIKDTLPDGLTYQAGSTCVDGKYTPSNQSSGGTTSSCTTTGDPNAGKDKDGHTVLTWSIPVKSDGTIHTVMYKTSIGDATDPDKDAKNGQQYLNTVTIQSTYSMADTTDVAGRKAQYGVRVSRTHSSNLATRADPLLMELGANVGFRDMIGNYSTSPKTDVLGVDILPYEGYHGTLTLSALTVTPKNGASLNTVNVYATDDTKARTVDPMKITNNQVKSWITLTMDMTTGKVTIPNGFTPTAFALITSTLPANSRYDLTLSLTPKNGQAGDTFMNLWTDGDNKVTAVSQVVSRSVSGFVWIDRDRDGSRGIGTSDVPYSDAHVKLVDKNGATVQSTIGQPLTTITGKDGAYKLENVPAGTGYRLRVTPPDWAHWTGSNLTKKAAQGVSNELSSKADPVTTAGVLQAGEIKLKPFPAVSTMSSARYEDTWENVGLLSIRQSSMPMTGDNTGLVAVLLISMLSAVMMGMAIVGYGRGRHRAAHSQR